MDYIQKTIILKYSIFWAYSYKYLDGRPTYSIN